MAAEEDPFHSLVAQVGEFYITDKSMKRAQNSMEAILAQGPADPRQIQEYLGEVRRYFTGFEREARSHLRRVDSRLEHLNQLHFNLTAERGVAVRRIEATQGVLARVDGIAGAQRV